MLHAAVGRQAYGFSVEGVQAKTGIVVVAVTEGGEAHGRLEGLVSPKDADLIDDRETLLHEIMDG